MDVPRGTSGKHPPPIPKAYMTQHIVDQAYINGAWVTADSGDTFPVTDPASGAVIAHVPNMGAAETERAITAAADAFPAWRACPATTRAALLRRLFERINETAEALAILLTRENGKPLAEARGEIRYGASFVSWFSEEARRVYGDLIPASRTDRRLMVSREPVGVCALITPWNFPSAMITRKMAAALAAGCTVVIKPAEDTPLSALALAALCQEVGFPPGVVNVVTTREPAAVGGAMCDDLRVRKLSFTGSTAVGRMLMAMCAPSLKRVSLELGGSAPFIVFEDADISAAVDGAMASKFRNNGQTCVASNRFLVHADVVDDFAARLAERVRALREGHGLDDGTDVGPMISEFGKDKVRRLLEDAKQKGATLVCGTIPAEENADLFVQPVVLTGVSQEMSLWEEEIFGPVVAIRTFSSEQQAVEMANETDYGLAAYFYTRDLSRSWRVREGLRFGMIGVNTGMISTAQAPFGGINQSGMGREGSRYGIEEYLNLKYTCVGIE